MARPANERGAGAKGRKGGKPPDSPPPVPIPDPPPAKPKPKAKPARKRPPAAKTPEGTARPAAHPAAAPALAPSNVSPVDSALARAALAKIGKGETPSRDEARALQRLEKEREDRERWRYYRTIPKGHYITLSGRQTKTLHQQAALYRLPLSGETIDLQQLLTRFHDFLAENAHKLAAGDEEFAGGESSEALEAWRREKARIARIERREKEGKVIDIGVWRDSASTLCGGLREAGRRLGEMFGPNAAKIMSEAIDAVERDLVQGGMDDCA